MLQLIFNLSFSKNSPLPRFLDNYNVKSVFNKIKLTNKSPLLTLRDDEMQNVCSLNGIVHKKNKYVDSFLEDVWLSTMCILKNLPNYYCLKTLPT